MKQAITYRNIWRVSYPIILSSAAQNIVNAVDTAFMGRLGENAVGAAGNSIIFYYAFVVAAIGFSVGGQIIVGRRNGEGDFEKVGSVIDHCLYTFIPVSLLLFGILELMAPTILGLVTKSPEILDISTRFIKYRSFGIFFAMINLVFRAFYVGITYTRVLTYSTFLMAGINVVLDYGLIFGNLGMPAMGVEGAALASVIAEAVTTVYFIMYTRSKKEFEKYKLFKFSKLQSEQLYRLVKLSFPTMVQSFLAVGSWFMFFLIIEKLGERELAVSHIVRSIYMIMVIPLFGFSQSTSTLVSNVIGQGEVMHVIRLIKKAALMGVVSCAAFFPFILFFPAQILALYTNNAELIAAAIPVLHVVNFAMLMFAVAYTTFSGVSGTGQTHISMFIEMTTLVIYLTFTWWVGIKLQLPLYFVWYSEFVYFGVMLTLSILYLRYGKWKDKVI